MKKKEKKESIKYEDTYNIDSYYIYYNGEGKPKVTHKEWMNLQWVDGNV